MQRHFAETIRELWRPFADALDPYHPELHYMRGPGPKWHAKRAGIVSAAERATADAAPAGTMREFPGLHAQV